MRIATQALLRATACIIAVSSVANAAVNTNYDFALSAGKRPDCTSTSLNITSMTLRSWDVVHAPSSLAHLKGTFNIFNPGTGEEYMHQRCAIHRGWRLARLRDWFDSRAQEPGLVPIPVRRQRDHARISASVVL